MTFKLGILKDKTQLLFKAIDIYIYPYRKLHFTFLYSLWYHFKKIEEGKNLCLSSASSTPVIIFCSVIYKMYLWGFPGGPMVKAFALSLLRAQVNPWWGNQEPTGLVVCPKQNQTANVIFLISYGHKCVFPCISGSQLFGLTVVTWRCTKILISGLVPPNSELIGFGCSQGKWGFWKLPS